MEDHSATAEQDEIKNMVDLCYQTLALADIDSAKYADKIRRNAERILSPAEAVPFLPAVHVTEEEARALRTGRARGDEGVRYVCDGELVAVGRTVLP